MNMMIVYIYSVVYTDNIVKMEIYMKKKENMYEYTNINYARVQYFYFIAKYKFIKNIK